jgi:hypothetical protein
VLGLWELLPAGLDEHLHEPGLPLWQQSACGGATPFCNDGNQAPVHRMPQRR